jgi:pyruvate formate lyase activating enzyme
MSWAHEYLLYDPDAEKRRELTGLVSDVQRFSIHDGPGIRTIVFLKGCPLRCAWCANPEAVSSRPEIMLIPRNCIGCGTCRDVCPTRCLTGSDGRISSVDRGRCLLPDCGRCQHVCYANAINISGRYLTAAEVIHAVVQDRDFYGRTGGGITFSGGEPFAQPTFLQELARAAKESKLHTAIETCGYATWDVVSPILDCLDCILYDLKQMDPDRHLQGTGVGNRVILENLKRIDARGKTMRVRLPLVPGFNDTEENVRATAAFISGLSGMEALDILPYHRMGEPKWGQLDREYLLHGVKPPERERVYELAEIARGYGIEVTVGG